MGKVWYTKFRPSNLSLRSVWCFYFTLDARCFWLMFQTLRAFVMIIMNYFGLQVYHKSFCGCYCQKALLNVTRRLTSLVSELVVNHDLARDFNVRLALSRPLFKILKSLYFCSFLTSPLAFKILHWEMIFHRLLVLIEVECLEIDVWNYLSCPK